MQVPFVTAAVSWKLPETQSKPGHELLPSLADVVTSPCESVRSEQADLLVHSVLYGLQVCRLPSLALSRA